MPHCAAGAVTQSHAFADTSAHADAVGTMIVDAYHVILCARVC
jgi:hypothetical protein